MDYESKEAFNAVLATYAGRRAKELLSEQAFHVGELTAIIARELNRGIEEAVSRYAQEQLATQNLKPDVHMRLRNAH